MYLLNKGIVEIKRKSFIKRVFCNHDFISGESCSSTGLTRISGQDIVTACKKCGVVKDRI